MQGKDKMGNPLLERQRIEESYHDKKYRNNISKNIGMMGSSAYKFFRKLRNDVTNLRVLDFGCGDGWLSIDTCKEGAAEVFGIDISKELIEKANSLAGEKGLSNKVYFLKMPGENLTFLGNYFDLCLGSAILHHTDLNLAIKNIFRVLKPGGRAIFIEPLNQNIFLKRWRKLTPWRRSPVEKALVNDDLELIREIFPNAKFYFFKLISIFTGGLFIIFPNNKFLFYLNDLFESFDSKLLKLYPSLGKYCAIAVLELIKEPPTHPLTSRGEDKPARR